MTSLGLAADAAAPPFNANFYIVAATVIPVLFIAIIVQGGGYQEMLRTSLSAARIARA
jgi:hypothetical protein